MNKEVKGLTPHGHAEAPPARLAAGNVRELENTIEYAMPWPSRISSQRISSSRKRLTAPQQAMKSLKEARDAFEKSLSHPSPGALSGECQPGGQALQENIEPISMTSSRSTI